MTDYIKRDVVLNDIGELCTLCYATLPNECGHHFIVEKELKIHWDYVKGLPAADVRENVHAHWIHRKNWGDRYVCSNCSKEMTESQIGAFCKECGAIMDGGDE